MRVSMVLARGVTRRCHLFVKSESNGEADDSSDWLATFPRGDEAGALKRLLCLAIKLLPAAREKLHVGDVSVGFHSDPQLHVGFAPQKASMLGIARPDAQYRTRGRVYLALPEHSARRAGTRRARPRRRDIRCAARIRRE